MSYTGDPHRDRLRRSVQDAIAGLRIIEAGIVIATISYFGLHGVSEPRVWMLAGASVLLLGLVERSVWTRKKTLALLSRNEQRPPP